MSAPSAQPAGKVICGQIVTFVDDPFVTDGVDSFTHITAGAIVVDEAGKIAWVGERGVLPGQYRDLPRDDHGERLILPGFIDTHLHFPQYRMIAAYGKDLLDWLNRYTFIEEQRYGDKAIAEQAAQLFLDELLRHGITAIQAFSTIHVAAVDALFAACGSRGMRVISGRTMMDRNAPTGLTDTAQLAYDESKALIERWRGAPRVGYGISPRFAVTSSEAQLEAAGALVREFPDAWMQTHLSENQREIATVAKDFPWSKDYTDVYQRYGLLGPKSCFAHGIHLSQRELDALSDAGSHIVHCPTSNNFLGSGHHQLRHCRQFVQVGVGSDIGGGTGFSMLQTLRDAYTVSQLVGARISAFQAFYLATLGNARVLGLEDEIGAIAPGMSADLAVLDPRATPIMAERHRLSNDLHDVLFALMIMGDDRAVTETYVAGLPCKPPTSTRK